MEIVQVLLGLPGAVAVETWGWGWYVALTVAAGVLTAAAVKLWQRA